MNQGVGGFLLLMGGGGACGEGTGPGFRGVLFVCKSE